VRLGLVLALACAARQLSPLLAALTLLVACATGTERFGRPIPTDPIAQIEVGRSTRAQVLTLLGPPARDHEDEDSDRADAAREPVDRALYWQYRERHELFATAILFTYFSQETLTDTLMVVFDERDVVEAVALEQETRR
jgi:hypothetical protein